MSLMYSTASTVCRSVPAYLRSSSQLRVPVLAIAKLAKTQPNYQHQPCQYPQHEIIAPVLWTGVSLPGTAVVASTPLPQSRDLNSEQSTEPLPKNTSANEGSEQDSDKRPTFDQLQEVQKILTESLSNLFTKPMDYQIYRKDILFIDNIRGKRIQGLVPYVQNAALLRTVGHLKFAFVKFVILNTDLDKDEGRITVRWRIVGISAFQVMLQFWKFRLWNWKGIMEKQGTWHDGISYFDVDGQGLIYRHIADKMMIDKDKEVVKVPKTVLAAGLFATILPDCTSLHYKQSSPSSNFQDATSKIIPT